MKHRWDDVRQLSRLLEAEAAGMPIDHALASRIAAALADRHPDIRDTLLRICERMQAQDYPLSA